MQRITTLIVAVGMTASLSSAACAAPTQEEEQFALEAASLMMLSTLNCVDAGAPERQPLLMKMVERAYETAGVKPSEYPSGEWTRKIFFYIQGNSFYSAVLNHDPASVASFCKIIREKIPTN